MDFKNYTFTFLFCFISMFSFSQTIIQGTVSDSTSTIIGAAVLLFKDSVQVQAVPTDFDGNYIFHLKEPGTYTIEAHSLGLASHKVTGVEISLNSTTTVDILLEESEEILNEIVIVQYRVPLINFDKSSSVSTVTAQSISNSPLKNVSGLKATSAGLSKDNNSKISIRGIRTQTSNYYVDGIKVMQNGNSTFGRLRSREKYQKIKENQFINSFDQSLSTLSIDVDRASYSNVRRFVQQGNLPPFDAVRTEEMINYFSYNYPPPSSDNEHPFIAHTNLTNCPWDSTHQLLHIGIKGKEINKEEIPPSNLVFLIDVSGSMNQPNKLPLLKSAFSILVNQLREEDRVAIVVYAGASGCVLESTPVSDKTTILNALNNLNAGGSTNGEAGIEQAYSIAKRHFIKDGNNRVILATDGDFNVGIHSNDDLLNLIEEKRESGVFLSVLAFGQGNYQDDKMQLIADSGNGNHSYIDNLSEAKKVFEEEFGGTMFTIAKDVKIQIEFNPYLVQNYRMIGYENRVLEAEDFNDDTKDAGEMGAGHSVTVMYELIPTGEENQWKKKIDPLKYFSKKKIENELTKNAEEIGVLKFRYKEPQGKKSTKWERIIPITNTPFNELSNDTKWAIQVALYAQLLRESKYVQSASYKDILYELNTIENLDKHQSEFIELVELTEILSNNKLSVKE